jgi:hypothetical protein
MKKTIKKSNGKSITIPKGVKVEIEKEETAAYKKKEKAEKAAKMKKMEKMITSAVSKGLSKRKK